MSEEVNKAIGWDDEVSEEMANEGRRVFETLPPGEYPFRVTEVNKKTFPGSAKLPACNMVEVTMLFNGPEGKDTMITVKFFMTQRTLWKIYEFMTAIGLHGKGDGATRIPWNKVDTSCVGRAKLTLRKFTGKDGSEKTVNDVEKFLEPLPEDEY